MSKFRTFKKNVLATLIGLAIVPSAYAGVVRDDVDYQLFRDFAENKGKFTVKRNNEPANIEIFDKNGKSLGVVLQGVPMPDFSFADRNTAITSLIHPQYVASVAHNEDRVFGGLKNIYGNILNQQNSNNSSPSFGGQNENPDAHHFSYHLVDRNDSPKYYDRVEVDEKGNATNIIKHDYNTPRLFKLVTEVSPISVYDFSNNNEDYKNKNIFSEWARIGSGVQFIFKDGTPVTYYEEDRCKALGKCLDVGYKYLTGGLGFNIGRDYIIPYIKDIVVIDTPIENHKFTNHARSGDSGSPILIFDKTKNQWLLLATYSTGSYYTFQGRFTPVHQSYFNKMRLEDIGAIIVNRNNGNVYDWSSNIDNQGETKDSIIKASDGSRDILLDVKIENNDTKNWQDENGLIAQKEKNANLAQIQKPKYTIKQEVIDIRNYFNHGKDLYIQGEKGTLNLKSDINQGAGALYFETDFMVKGENENITWLGAGVSVAKDKTVEWQIKNPEHDRLSKIGEGVLLVNGQGENKGDISVGDGLVILNQQGGKAFNKVGIVSGRPTVKLVTGDQVTPDNIYFGYRGGRLDVNGNDLTFNYIKNVDEGAKIVNHHADKTATVTIKTDATDPNKSAFNGVFGENNQDFFGNPLKDKTYHNGKLNIIYAPENPQENKPFLLSGGTNLNGNLTVENGSLLLSGRPTPHAYDHLNNIEPFKDNDWISRDFTAKTIVVKDNAKLTIGRNVKNVKADFELNGNATAQLGFINGSTPVCVRSDYKGDTTCENKSYGDDVLKEIPTTNIVGNIVANDNSTMTIGNAHLTGKSTANSNTSTLTLTPKSKWTMTGDSSLGHLVMENGSEITLNANPSTTSQFNTLTVNGDLKGQGQFNYLTNLTDFKGDKVHVTGNITDEVKLNVTNIGTEPTKSKEHLTLLTAQGTINQAPVLANPEQKVDLGAFSYTLKSDDNKNYYLWSESLEKQIDTDNSINQAQIISRYTNAGLSELSAQANTLLHIGHGLTHQLLTAQGSGLWVIGRHYKNHHQSDLYRDYQKDENIMHIGAGHELELKKHDVLLGGAWSFSHANQEFSNNIHGSSDLNLFSLYSKITGKHGGFINADIGYGQGKTELSSAGEKVDVKRNIATASVNVGKTFNTDLVDIQPSMGVRYHRFSDVDYTLNGAKIHLDTAHLTSYRAGILLEKVIPFANGLTFKPSWSSNYIYADGSNANINVNGYDFKQQFGRYTQHEIGLSIGQKAWDISLNASHADGNEIEKQQSIGFKLNYKW